MKFNKRLAALITVYATWPGLALAGSLAEVPLGLRGAVPSNVLFDISVEWPTAITAAYADVSDYLRAKQYEGLFDPNLCYEYNSNLGSDATPVLAPTGGFAPKATATNHGCTGLWSGNFLNWATMTGLDSFRYATTGGNRVVDTQDATVLERTYITSNGNAADFFPRKTFNPATSSEFAGATPYTDNTTFRVDNWSKGSAMELRWTTTETTTTTTSTNAQTSCTGTVSTGSPYCNQFTATINAVNSTGTCTSWSGSGTTSGNPFKCTAFSNFLPINAVPTLNSSTCLNTTSRGSSGSTRYICTRYDTRFSYPTTTTTNTDHSNTFNVRVKACDPSLPLRDNCQQYSNGNYKPVGEIQRNGEKMRFGVFAYYNAPDIDNAVMRARLKYVGPKKYSSSAFTLDNSNKEWEPDTGVFIRNPDADTATGTTSFARGAAGNTVPNSGVINYLNKFGSNTQSYKSYDNISKIYYESLRYLRKLAPTPDFYQNATTANDDDFPVITDWYKGGTEDPIQYSCQKNYIITMGDQFTHCDKRLPGGSISPYNNNVIGSPDAWLRTSGDWCGVNFAGSSNVANDENSLANGDSLNVTNLTNTIGSFEGLANLGTTRTGSGGNASYYMAGLAHWAATNDIRPPGPTNVKNPVVEVNDGGEIKKVEMPQTVKTFVIDVEESQTLGAYTTNQAVPPAVPSAYRSQFWYTAKYGGGGGEYGYYEKGTATSTEDPEAKLGVKPNGNVVGLKWSKGSDTYKSTDQTYVGEWPKTLLRAGDPASMIASIKEALATVDAETGTNSALSQSSGDLRTQTDAFIYRATFDSSAWAGELQAFKISGESATLGRIDGTPVWSASEHTRINTPGSRLILTYNDGVAADNLSVSLAKKGPSVFDPTKPTESLSARQQYYLNRNGNNVEDERMSQRMGYLRGESTYEEVGGGAVKFTTDPKESWRARIRTLPDKSTKHFVLGDIINSSPVYVAQPDTDVPGKDYNLFAQDVRGRKPMIYLGANDGMLHGFDANSGEELLAYVPSSVYSRLSQLTSTTYSHKYFVDGTPTVSEACKGSCSGQSDWFTLLVGGLNAGGQGLYALDITDPDDFTASNVSKIVRWEFTDHDDQDLGFTFSKPIVRLMNNGKWAVIVGNGFNNTVEDGRKSDKGRAYLYVLYVDGPGGGSWDEGTDFHKIELSASDEPAGTNSPANGLASVAGVDRDLNGTVDYVYAGDRRGNLWKVDVSSANPSEWKSAFGGEGPPKPLFIAKYRSGATTTPQSITTGVKASAHPNGGFIVMFGTGSFIESTDNVGPFNTDSYYGIWDKDDGTPESEGTQVTGANADKLQKQKVIATVEATIRGEKVEFLFQSSCEVNYNDVTVPSNANGNLCPSDIAHDGTGQQLGWLFDLKQDGERAYSDVPLVQSGILTVTSVQPSEDPCVGNTVGREYNLNYLTGGAAGAGIFDLNGDGTINSNDLINLTSGETGSGMAASGRKLEGGASKTPVRFLLRHPTADDSSTGTSLYACKDFIPGWGCPSQLAPQRNCQRWVEDVVSDELLKAGAVGLGGTKKCLPGKAGRLTWRQITK